MAPAKKKEPASIDWTAAGQEVLPWSSGNVLLDWISGIGGLPRGRVVECYGPESSGKSSLAFQVASYVWRTYGIASWYRDMEHAFDPTYAAALGLTPQGLKLPPPEQDATLEDMLEALHMALEPEVFAKAPFALWIVDSVAACACRSELAGGVDQRTAGLEKARIWSDNLRTLVGKLDRTGVTLVLVNQIRDNVDLSGDFVPPGLARLRPKTRTPGGRAIKFFSSLRIEYEPTSEIKEERWNAVTRETEKVAVGKTVWLKVTKNKVAAPPWRKTRLQIRDGIGFDLAQNLLEFAVVHDFVKRDRGVYTFPAELSATGLPFVIAAQDGYTGDAIAAQLLRERPNLTASLTAMVMERLDGSTDYRQDRPPVPDEDDEALLHLPEPEEGAPAPDLPTLTAPTAP